MIIKEGYDSEKLTIKIRKSEVSTRKAEVWIEMAHPDGGRGQVETLSYATLDELLDLQDEVNSAIKSIAGLE
jgi:hypothetical protein